MREKQEVQFKVVKENGNGYDKQFVIATVMNGEIIAQAQHFSKKKAEQLSAEATCTKLEIV